MCNEESKRRLRRLSELAHNESKREEIKKVAKEVFETYCRIFNKGDVIDVKNAQYIVGVGRVLVKVGPNIKEFNKNVEDIRAAHEYESEEEKAEFDEAIDEMIERLNLKNALSIFCIDFDKAEININGVEIGDLEKKVIMSDFYLKMDILQEVLEKGKEAFEKIESEGGEREND